MNIGIETVMSIIVQLLVAGAVYGGIRADLKNMHENHRNLSKRVERVEDRVDSVMDLNQRRR